MRPSSHAHALRRRRLRGSTLEHLSQLAQPLLVYRSSFRKRSSTAGLRRAQPILATYNADVATYRQTVLVRSSRLRTTWRRPGSSPSRSSRRSRPSPPPQYATLATGRYETGVDPYLNVLTAQTTLLADQQTLVTLQMQQMVDAVELVQALGGGWDRTAAHPGRCPPASPPRPTPPSSNSRENFSK